MSLREMRQCAENIGKEGQLYNAEETHDTFLMGERTELVVNKILQFLETHPLLQVNTAELRTMKAALEPISQYDLANVHRTSSDDSLRLFELQQLADEKAQKDRQKKADADRDALLQLIRFDPGVVRQDILRCAQSGYIMNDEQKSRAAAMIRSEMFKSFLRDAHSSRSLLVNGNEDTARADGISPLSLVSAELSRLSESAGAVEAPVFVLNYFCAEHCPSPLFPSLEAIRAMGFAKYFVQNTLDLDDDVDLDDSADWEMQIMTA
ncbi:hypothetical protein K4K56_007454 [Colletotrichum sp. SAR 10_98]|nr:hypothetical protein K4K56_007454 [Colletotrichum sp. SAR 10_98]